MTNPGPAGVLQLQELVTRLISLSVGLGFVAMLVMLLWGGIKFITSGGEAKAVQEASGILTWALLGILFLVLAILVLRVVSVFTGRPELLQFCLGFNGCYSTGAPIL